MPRANLQYRLTRRLPDGKEMTYSSAFETRRKAAQMAFYGLLDNSVTDAKDATAYASRLQDAPVEVAIEHASGWAFTINAEEKP